MNSTISRLDLIVVAVFAAGVTLLSGQFSPSARVIETRSALAIVIPSQKSAETPQDPDATVPNAVPDSKSWNPEDGQSRYGDKNAPDNDDDDDDSDDSYDPPGPDDTIPI